MSPKGPSSSFLNFATEYMLINPNGPHLTFFGTMRHFLTEKNQKVQIFWQKIVLRFLSLKYSTDFRHSRLVSSVK